MKKILRRKKRSIIYIGGVIISLIFICFYLIPCGDNFICEKWQNVFMSVGVSVISAIVLGWLLENAEIRMKKTQDASKIKQQFRYIDKQMRLFMRILNICTIPNCLPNGEVSTEIPTSIDASHICNLLVDKYGLRFGYTTPLIDVLFDEEEKLIEELRENIKRIDYSFFENVNQKMQTLLESLEHNETNKFVKQFTLERGKAEFDCLSNSIDDPNFMKNISNTNNHFFSFVSLTKDIQIIIKDCSELYVEISKIAEEE